MRQIKRFNNQFFTTYYLDETKVLSLYNFSYGNILYSSGPRNSADTFSYGFPLH